MRLAALRCRGDVYAAFGADAGGVGVEVVAAVDAAAMR